MKYHYLTQYDEFEFDKLAERADPVLLDRARIKKMHDVIARRREVLNRLYELDHKYRPSQEEREELVRLREEAKNLMREVG